MGFAGILGAAGEVRNAQGEILRGQQAFNAALQVSEQIQINLRLQSLRTTATFGELAFAFQQAIGPGLQRGFNTDQIVALTVRLSQAASSIGLAQNQLAEEIRSILSGTARAQTTRLAQLFEGGATGVNRLVRSAASANDLFQQLNSRLETTARAAALAAQTVTGLAARIRDALGVVAGAAATDLTAGLTEVLQQIFETLIDINEETGEITPSAGALQAFRALFDAVTDVFNAFRDVSQSIGLDGLITASKALGTAIRIAGRFVVGLLDGLQLLGTIALSIIEPFKFIQEITGEISEVLVELAATLGTILSIVFSVRTAIGLWNIAFRRAAVEAVATGTAVQGIKAGIAGATLGIGKLILGIGVLAVGFQQVFSFSSGLSFTLADTLKKLRINITSTFSLIFQTVGFGAKALANEIFGFFSGGQIELFDLDADSAKINKFLTNTGRQLEKLEQEIAQRQGILTRELAERAFPDITANIDFDQPFSDFAIDAINKALEEQEKNQVSVNSRLKEATQEERNALIVSAQKVRVDEAKTRAAQALRRLTKEGASDERISVQQAESRLGILRAELNVALRSQLKTRQELDAELEKNNTIERQEILKQKLGILDRAASARQSEIVAKINLQEEAIKQAELALQLFRIAQEAQLQSITATTTALQEQNFSQTILNDLANRGAAQSQLRVQEQRNLLRELEAGISLKQQEQNLELEALQAQAALLSEGEELSRLQRTINALKAQGLAIDRQTVLEIESAKQKLEELRLIAEGSVGEGFARGARNFAERFASEFEAGIRIAEGALNRFASFVSQTLVDAFDPTKDFDILERFARLLQDIARLVLQQMVQLAIANAILGSPIPVVSKSPTSFASSLLFSNAEGGIIPGGPGHEVASSPKGVPRSDTVPGWLTPGEWVAPLKTMGRLGSDFFERLRAGAGNPMELRSMVGLGGARRARRASAKGFFQAGGIVGNQVRRAEQSVASAPPISPSTTGAGVQQAVIVASEGSMEKLIRGGAPALRRFVIDMAPDIAAAGK